MNTILSCLTQAMGNRKDRAQYDRWPQRMVTWLAMLVLFAVHVHAASFVYKDTTNEAQSLVWYGYQPHPDIFDKVWNTVPKERLFSKEETPLKTTNQQMFGYIGVTTHRRILGLRCSDQTCFFLIHSDRTEDGPDVLVLLSGRDLLPDSTLALYLEFLPAVVEKKMCAPVIRLNRMDLLTRQSSNVMSSLF